MRELYSKLFAIIFAFILAVGNQSAYSYSFNKNVDQDELINITVYEKINPAIVAVDAQVDDGISSGTGCVIESNGLILTSSHVIDGAKTIEVTTANGEVYKANVTSILGKNKDLALLKIVPKKDLPIIRLGDSSKLRVGQKVLAIGNPFGFNGTLTTGIVSRIDYTRNKIQTDAAINPGSSGGPIVNAEGEVIGISQSIFNPDNNKSNIGIGFAIPVNEAKVLISQYNSKGKSKISSN